MEKGIHLREWAWCDALFMGPPALAYLTQATGDPTYLNTSSKLVVEVYRILIRYRRTFVLQGQPLFQQKRKEWNKSILEPRQWLGYGRFGEGIIGDT
jgi:hypothetical protein